MCYFDAILIKKREKSYICAYCNINENGDQTPFYASEELCYFMSLDIFKNLMH